MLLSPANIHFTKALRRDYEVHDRTPLPESRRPVRLKPGTSDKCRGDEVDGPAVQGSQGAVYTDHW